MTEINFISIASRWDAARILYRGEHATMREAVEAAANLADANLADANLADANLSGADLSGANLSGANLRNANLADANLADANLSGADLRGASLSGANLSGANLSGANLRNANLADADLSGANLRNANLADADLSGASLAGAPVVADLEKKMDEVTWARGALNMASWHSCATTHCRAGWAIHLAGEAGADLERRIGPNAAGALIYAASTADGYVPDFFASDEEARKDIVRRAETAK